MVQHAARCGVDIRPWVLGLSVLGQDTRSDFVGLFHELDGWAGQKIWPFVAELLKGNEPRIRTSQNTVPVSMTKGQNRAQGASETDRPRNNASTFKGFPQVTLNRFVSDLVVPDLFLHLKLPSQYFLVGQTAGGIPLVAGAGSLKWRTHGVVQPRRTKQQSTRCRGQRASTRPDLEQLITKFYSRSYEHLREVWAEAFPPSWSPCKAM